MKHEDGCQWLEACGRVRYWLVCQEPGIEALKVPLLHL